MKNAIRTSLPTYLKGGDAGLNTKTRIMASLGTAVRAKGGPGGQSPIDLLRRMVHAGATIFRINAAHLGDDPKTGLTYEEGQSIVQDIQKLRMELRQIIPIYFDLAGPKVRVKTVLSLKPATEVSGSRAHPSRGDAVDLYLRTPAIEHALRPLFEAQRASSVSDWDDDDEVRRFYDNARVPELSAGAKLLLSGDLADFTRIDKKQPINLKDGRCRLIICESTPDRLQCIVDEVDDEFEFREQQGASPCQYAFERVITDEDKRDIHWAVQRGLDVISLSFVCTPHDGAALREEISAAKERVVRDTPLSEQAAWPRDRRAYLSPEYQIPIFAKIETAYAVEPGLAKAYASRPNAPALPVPVDPLREIIAAFDGVMVARGDLAIEVRKVQVPNFQRRILEYAREMSKPAIVATEILQNMQKGGTSTRAEISDINAAVWQEADILMLSGETASGKNPVKVITEMRKAILEAEEERRDRDLGKNFQELAAARQKTIADRDPSRVETAVFHLPQASHLCQSAATLQAEAILVSAGSGYTAREVSGFRPWQRIITISDDLLIGIELSLHRGVFPVVTQHRLERTIEDFIDIANEVHHKLGIPYRPNGGTSFVVPGSVRIAPRLSAPPDVIAELNSIVYLFQLPKKAKDTPEVERKYALLREHYEILCRVVRKDAISWKRMEQVNAYFMDAGKDLLHQRWSVRLRKETIIETSDNDSFDRPVACYFTIKGDRKVVDGEAVGFEEEYDVTREVLDQGVWGDIAAPEMARWAEERVKELFGVATGQKLETPMRFVASMVNTRTAGHMPNDTVLELDASQYQSNGTAEPRIEYELEVELRNDERTRKLITEYIEDKCAANGVRFIRVDKGEPHDCLRSRGLKYPSKVLQVLASAKGDLIPEEEAGDVMQAVDCVRERLRMMALER